MRYYDISITNPSDGKQLLHYTSHPRGVNAPPDPGALQIEVDILQLSEGQSSANSLIRIWGIPLSILSSGSNFALKNCTVLGGMGRGLPLADPSQAGQIAAGQIIHCFGNWVGNVMTLDIILNPGLVKEAKSQNPNNLTVNMPANQSMHDMIDQTLGSAFPSMRRNIQISDNLKLPNPEFGFYASLPQFAQYVLNLSRKIIGAKGYLGVHIFAHGDTIHAFDGSTEQKPKQILPTDLIGQPTWIGNQTVQAALVLRGDLKLGSFVKLPEGLITTRASSLPTFSPLTAQSIFKGTYWVNKVRHVGNFRQPDGRAWTTILDCLALKREDWNSTDLGPGYGLQTGPGYT